MWFAEKATVSKSRGHRRKKRIRTIRLNSRVASSKKRGDRRPVRVTMVALALVLVVALGASIWFGVRFVGRALFSGNRAFVIRHLDIKDGAMMTESLIREYTRIEEGMNLFGVNIGQVRADFLSRAPSVKSMQISRLLPDTLRIEITERMPVARLGWKGPLVVDRVGTVFVFKSQSDHLPFIIGYRGDGLRPGSKLHGTALAGLEVFDVCDDHPALGLNIEAIEVDNGDRLTLRLADRKAAKLAWEEMGTASKGSRRDLLMKLGMLSRALRSDEGRNLSSFNVTLDGRIYGN